VSDLVWEKIFNLEKQVEYLHKFQKEQTKINSNLIRTIKKIEEKNEKN
jgi:hypothetical protein